VARNGAASRIAEVTYPRADLPRELEIQVLAFMRMAWGDAFRGDDRFRDRLWHDPNATHFVHEAGPLLVSHVMVVPISVEANGGSLLIGGVASVMTYPQFRGEGHGAAVMRAAGTSIEQGRFDLGMLFCDPETVPFYARLGWHALEPGRITVRGVQPDDVVMTYGSTASLPAVLDLEWSW
jgi:predicted N-acetyltransferase YhbS